MSGSTMTGSVHETTRYVVCDREKRKRDGEKNIHALRRPIVASISMLKFESDFRHLRHVRARDSECSIDLDSSSVCMRLAKCLWNVTLVA